MNNHDKVWRAIERKVGHIVFLHDEAKGYAFKTFNGEWRTIQFAFANDAAGLGYINRSLI
jgi:hypothetical protein